MEVLSVLILKLMGVKIAKYFRLLETLIVLSVHSINSIESYKDD